MFVEDEWETADKEHKNIQCIYCESKNENNGCQWQKPAEAGSIKCSRAVVEKFEKKIR